MLNQFSRTQLLLGRDGMERLFNARVAVFGIGGVGGYTVEALVRSGVGALELSEQAQKAGSCLRNDPANSAHMPMGIPIYFTIVTSLCSTSR